MTRNYKINPCQPDRGVIAYSVVRMHPLSLNPCLFELNFLAVSRALIYGFLFTCIPHILRSLDCYLAFSSLLKYLLDVGIEIIAPYLL